MQVYSTMTVRDLKLKVSSNCQTSNISTIFETKYEIHFLELMTHTLD